MYDLTITLCLNNNFVPIGRSFVLLSVGLLTVYAHIKVRMRYNSASNVNGWYGSQWNKHALQFNMTLLFFICWYMYSYFVLFHSQRLHNGYFKEHLHLLAITVAVLQQMENTNVWPKNLVLWLMQVSLTLTSTYTCQRGWLLSIQFQNRWTRCIPTQITLLRESLEEVAWSFQAGLVQLLHVMSLTSYKR